jgi:hypothetical protein
MALPGRSYIARCGADAEAERRATPGSKMVVSDHGGDGPKGQRMVIVSVQISTKATRLMVMGRGGVLEAF